MTRGFYVILLSVFALLPASLSAVLASSALRGDALALALTLGLSCMAAWQIQYGRYRNNTPARAHVLGIPLGVAAALLQPYFYGWMIG